MSADMKLDPAPPEPTRLQVADRCDMCKAQAFVIAEKGDLVLHFCGHHGSKFEFGLVEQGFEIWDETHRINEAPSPSASPDESYA